MKPILRRVPVSKPVVLMPAGCLHWPIGEKDLLNEWVEAVRTTDGALTILMGDTSDFARTHYRKHLRSYVEDENSQEAIDGYVREDIRKLAKVLMPIKSKVMGAISGNHYYEFMDGTNSEQELCRNLGIPYLGPTGLIRLEFVKDYKKKGKDEAQHQIVIWAHHHGGSMGGRTTGGDVNALERAEGSFDADIYLLSHTHRRYATRSPLLTLTKRGEPRIVERVKVFARTGAFLKGYKEDSPNNEQAHRPTYAEQKAMRPTDLGWVTINIKLTKVHNANTGENDYRRNITLSY